MLRHNHLWSGHRNKMWNICIFINSQKLQLFVPGNWLISSNAAQRQNRRQRLTSALSSDCILWFLFVFSFSFLFFFSENTIMSQILVLFSFLDILFQIFSIFFLEKFKFGFTVQYPSWETVGTLSSPLEITYFVKVFVQRQYWNSLHAYQQGGSSSIWT